MAEVVRIAGILSCFDADKKYTVKIINGKEKDYLDSDEHVTVSESPITNSLQFVPEFSGAPAVSIVGELDTWSIEFPVRSYAKEPSGSVLLYGPKGTAEFTPV